MKSLLNSFSTISTGKNQILTGWPGPYYPPKPPKPPPTYPPW